MKREDLQKILAINSAIHEIGIICEDLNIVDSKVDGLNKKFSNKIESWGQIAPELGYTRNERYHLYFYGYYFNSPFFLGLSIQCLWQYWKEKKSWVCYCPSDLIKEKCFLW